MDKHVRQDGPTASLKKDAMWTALDTVVSQGLAFVFRLMMAKLLAPAEFGLIALALSATALLQVINNFGLTAALIQRKELTDEAINTTFNASVILSTTLFLVNVLAVAPLAALYFHAPSVGPLIAVLGVALLFTPVSSVARALIFRDLKFKQYTVVRMISSLLGIGAAAVHLLLTHSVWAFATQVLVSQVTLTGFMFVLSKWRPKVQFTREGFQQIFSYSGLVFLNDMAVSLARNLDVFVIGRVLSRSDVGLYALAFYITDVARENLMGILNRVLFVHYSKLQDDKVSLRDNYVRVVRWNCAFLFPLMLCVALFGPSVLHRGLGADWAGMGPVIQALSVAVMIHAAGGAGSTLLKAIGRPGLDLMVFLGTTAFFLVPSVFLGAYWGGVFGVACGIAVSKALSILTRQIILDRLLGSTFWKVMRASGFVLMQQAPIFVIWVVGMVLWPRGDWVRDIALGTLSMGVAGAMLLASQPELVQRLKLRRA